MRGARCPVVTSALLAVVATICVAAPAQCAANWPMWMENPTHTPTPQFEPDGPLTVAWTAHCRGVFGGPVVYEGTVYFADADGFVHAVDDSSGVRRWQMRVAVPGVEWREATEERPRGSPPSPGLMATPAVDESCVYVGGLDGSFQARDRLNGELVWDQAIAGAMASSPLLTGDLVVVGTRQGELVAMARADGEVRWSYDAGGAINSSPASAEGKVVVGTEKGIVAVTADTGELVWAHQFLDGQKCDASPCIVGDRVYAATWGGAVCALSLSEGERVWERSVTRGPIFASPTVAEGLVYVATTDGIVAALEAESGESAWEEITEGRRGEPTAAYASPVACGRVLLVGCDSGRVCILDAQTGERVSEITQHLDRYVHGTPAVTDEAVYVSSETSPRTGQGTVVKFACRVAVAPTSGLAQRQHFPRLACQELGLLTQEDQGTAAGYGGWALAAERSVPDPRALDRLVELGLIAAPEAWRSGRLGRYQLAAFYYSLFFDPNPLGVTLPQFEAPDLIDAPRFPAWLDDAPQLVVGLGIMEARNGRFDGTRTVTMAELRSSLQRARELLDELGHAEG